MNRPASHPLDGTAPDMLAEYSAFTGIGRALRKGEAVRELKRLRDSAVEIETELERVRQIRDRIARNAELNRVEMAHVLEFGISPHDRAAFQHVLEDVADHGGLTLQESAALAHARNMQHVQSVNGPSSEVPSNFF